MEDSPGLSEKDIVVWGYVIQWLSLLMLPAIVVSLIYILLYRRRVTLPGLVTHMKWQFATCLMMIAAIPVAFVLLFIGLAGVATDAPVSIVATFTLLGGAAVFPLWMIYRFARGTIRYSRGEAMPDNVYL